MTTPETTSPVVQPQTPKRFSLGSHVEKWLIWRATSFCLWYWILGAFVQHASGADKLSCNGWITLAPLLSAFYFVIGGKWMKLAGFIVYLFVFPVTFCVLICWYCFRGLSTQWKVFWFSTSDLAAIFCFFLLLITWVCIGTFSADNQLTVSISADVVLMLLLLVWALRWASDPMRRIHTIAVGAIKTGSKVIDKVYLHPLLAGRDESKTKNALAAISAAEEGLKKLLRNAEHNLRQTLIPMTVVGFLAITVIVVTGYAFAVFGGEHISQPAFTGLDKTSSFPMCWLYSLTALTVSPLDGVKPATELGYALFTSELISAVVLLTVFFSMFSIAIEYHSERRIEGIKMELQTGLNWLSQKRAEVSGPVIDLKPEAGTIAKTVPANVDANTTAAAVALASIHAHPLVVSRGSQLTLVYEIDSQSPVPEEQIWLGATLSADNRKPIQSVKEDKHVALVAGRRTYQRVLSIPKDAQPGRYKLGMGVWRGRVGEKSQSLARRYLAEAIIVE